MKRKMFRDAFWESTFVAKANSSSVQIWNTHTHTKGYHSVVDHARVSIKKAISIRPEGIQSTTRRAVKDTRKQRRRRKGRNKENEILCREKNLCYVLLHSLEV